MRGIGGLKGWSWIFILEGLFTVVFGTSQTSLGPNFSLISLSVSAFVSYFYIADSPDSAKFLTPAEKEEVTRRLDADNNGLSKEFEPRFSWDAVKDWKTYVYSTFLRINCYRHFDRVPSCSGHVLRKYDYNLWPFAFLAEDCEEHRERRREIPAFVGKLILQYPGQLG
jgi:hypothetical protein